jgi:hypothetical protein
LYRSPEAIMAQAIRASLSASAMAASLVKGRERYVGCSISVRSQVQAASGVKNLTTGLRAIANYGWSRYAALTV